MNSLYVYEVVVGNREYGYTKTLVVCGKESDIKKVLNPEYEGEIVYKVCLGSARVVMPEFEE